MSAAIVPLRAAAPAPAAQPAPPASYPADRFLRLPQVLERIPLSTATLYRRMAAGKFPQGRPIGGSRTVGWRESEINAFIAGEWIAPGGATP